MMFETPQEWKSEIWWRNRTADERLYHARIPSRMLTALEGVDHRTALGTRSSTSQPDTFPNQAGLLIRGDDGLAKSIKAAAHLRYALSTDNDKRSGRWIAADDYIDMLKDSFDSTGGLPAMYGNPHLIKYIKGVFDILVIDGLGEERKTEFAAHELGSLIRRRYDHYKPTIITTRMTMSEIVDRYGDRMAVVLADYNMEKV